MATSINVGQPTSLSGVAAPSQNSNGSAADFLRGVLDNSLGRNTNSAVALNNSRNGVGEGPSGQGQEIRNYSQTLHNDDCAKMPMDDKSQRLAALNKFSQVDNDNNTTADQSRCGQSSIVAGMYYANGRQGVSDLIDSMKNYNDTNHLGAGGDMKEMAALQKRINSGGDVSEKDLSKVQEALYYEMNARQSQLGLDADGTHYKVLDDFIENQPKVKDTFDKNGMAVGYEDTTGANNKGNHFILAMKVDGKPTVYDPYPIAGADGSLNQVTQDPADIQKYVTARQDVDGRHYVYNGGEHQPQP